MSEPHGAGHPLPGALEMSLARQLTVARGLLDILRRETTALGDDITGVADLATQKLSAIEELETLHTEYRGYCRSLGIDAGERDRLRVHLQRHGGSAAVARWQELSRLIEQCREINLANGVAIERGRRHADAALALLTGRNSEAGGLYDAKGLDHPRPGRGMLAKV